MTKVSQSKFVEQLSSSNDKIKSARAEMLAEETKVEVVKLVNNLESEKLKLKNTIINMTDLAPDNSYSLRPGGADFEASTWVNELHKATLKLELKEVELASAQGILTEWF